MLYILLGKDVRSKEGRLYAKKGKRLKVLFRNKNHYLCEVGKFNIPVFDSQVEQELIIKQNEEDKEIVEECDDEGTEGAGEVRFDEGGEDFDYRLN